MSTAIDRLTSPNIPTPGHVGQATAVEQSRAVAEVQLAAMMARQFPRDIDTVEREMRRACSRVSLAEKAFFSFPRGRGANVTGASIHLARELARVYNNVHYGIHEMRRDDAGGYSEMQAYAWDLETNTRAAQTFVVPHGRDKNGRDGGVEKLTALRDIYENNANNGARRVREAIFAVLPRWFTDEAQAECRKALDGDPGQHDGRTARAVEAWASQDVTVPMLEKHLGRRRRTWTPADVTELGILYQSLSRGEITKAEAFPEERVSAAELAAPATAPAPPAATEDVWTAAPQDGAP